MKTGEWDENNYGGFRKWAWQSGVAVDKFKSWQYPGKGNKFVCAVSFKMQLCCCYKYLFILLRY